MFRLSSLEPSSGPACVRVVLRSPMEAELVSCELQSLARPGGAQLASGASRSIGGYSCTASATLSDAGGASAALVSVPFKELHKTHDLAKQLIVTGYRQHLQENGGQPPSSLSIGNLIVPGANMVLLQVCRVSEDCLNVPECSPRSVRTTSHPLRLLHLPRPASTDALRRCGSVTGSKVMCKGSGAAVQVTAKVPFTLDVAFQPTALRNSQACIGEHLTSVLAQRSNAFTTRCAAPVLSICCQFCEKVCNSHDAPDILLVVLLARGCFRDLDACNRGQCAASMHCLKVLPSSTRERAAWLRRRSQRHSARWATCTARRRSRCRRGLALTESCVLHDFPARRGRHCVRA